MSTKEATLKGGLHAGVGGFLAGSIALSVSGFKEMFGFERSTAQAAEATNANTVNVQDAATNWLTSIVGAFDGNPVYGEMIENMREAERRLAAEYDGVE